MGEVHTTAVSKPLQEQGRPKASPTVLRDAGCTSISSDSSYTYPSSSLSYAKLPESASLSMGAGRLCGAAEAGGVGTANSTQLREASKERARRAGFTLERQGRARIRLREL